MVVDNYIDYIFVHIVFFFKQKTAYEMRISDWSSDVCSSDLIYRRRARSDDASHGGRCHCGLPVAVAATGGARRVRRALGSVPVRGHRAPLRNYVRRLPGRREGRYRLCRGWASSAEHTSELQSLMRISYAVFCLKNKN